MHGIRAKPSKSVRIPPTPTHLPCSATCPQSLIAPPASGPAVRRGWLEGRPENAGKRGSDGYVEVSWPEALDLVANELRRVHAEAGPRAIFGGSYGWSSAGRFHHAQSQIHRFLNVLGGYVRSFNTYSSGAAMVIIPHVLGPYDSFDRKSVTWDAIERSSELIVAFGGMAVKNTDVHGGGISQHVVRPALNGARARGARFVLISPLKDDIATDLAAEWLPASPEPMSPSCSRSLLCSSKRGGMTGSFLTAIRQAIHASRLICWDTRMASRRTRNGQPASAVSLPTRLWIWHAAWRTSEP
ncbi:hypothetical protein GGD56_000761 [Rhizobium mongolense]|uniref:Molybdopterin oxidoreductase domain-containing protein n=1 Tax=Rhizobium mongolense TaxID=57676 RepID=A0ABR6IGE7_9HYPH|nr:hypothetical protein [Rhizobium mongolense]